MLSYYKRKESNRSLSREPGHQIDNVLFLNHNPIMAKPRKTYGKRPIWHWLIFYLIIGGIIYGLLYFSGIINFPNNNSGFETDYSSNSSGDYSYIE